jgi:ATP-binding cassette subfamily C protein
MIRTYREVLVGFRRRSAFAVVMLALSGLGEGIGIAALLPFIEGSLRTRGQHVEYFGLTGDRLATAALITFVVSGIASAITRYFAESRIEGLRGLVEESLRTRMTAALVDADWIAFQGASAGDNTKAILQEGAEVGRGVEGFLLGLGYAGSAVVFVIIALAMSWELTLATLVFGVVTVIVYREAMRRSRQRSQHLSEGLGDLTHFVTDFIANFKFYKSSGASSSVMRRAEKVFRAWREDFVRIERYPPATRSAFDVAGLVFIAAILGVAVLIAGASPVKSFVFLALFYRLAPKLQQTQQRLLQGATQLAWWKTWEERYRWATAVREHPSGTTRFDAPPVVIASGVTYAYPDHEPAVRDISWNLAPGGCVAFVGPSGSGKTTLLDLVLGLLTPTGGTLSLDGVDMVNVDRGWWQRRIGLVMQETAMFPGRLLDNIAWLDDEPDRARALQCAEQAHMGPLLAELPDGLDSQVGHRGSRLSGGQRQRVALARALYREPWLLVLDEATSALDAASELAIKEALAELKGKVSILIVAHQLRTVDIADDILVLDHGSVVERGTWGDLARRGDGQFRKMLDLQTGSTPVEAS